MLHVLVRLCVVLLGLAAACSGAEARRAALVIGIDDYLEVAKLEKAVGDARAMSATLRQLGFEVTEVLNPGRRELNIAISEFTSSLTADDIAFVHFSGHGVEIGGENYLLPADIPKPQAGREDAVKYEAIGLQRLIAQIARSGARTRLFVIDACRNNPFAQSGTRGVGGARGLAYVAAPAGTFVMYSAGYGQLALDKLNAGDTAPTSVYTRVLTGKLLVPGRTISEIAQDVRSEVQSLAKSVGHDQRPAYYDELSDRLVLHQPPGTAAAAQPQPQPAPTDNQIELAFWETVKDSEQAELYAVYLERYPRGNFAPLARLKLKTLKQDQPAAQQQQAQLPDRQIVVEQKPQEAAPAVEPQPADPAPDQPDREVTRKVQAELNRLGCNAGTADGLWGRNSAAALDRFARHGKTRVPGSGPSPQLLDLLQARTARVCPCPKGTKDSNGRCITVARKSAAEPAPRKAVTNKPKPQAPATPKERSYSNPRIGGLPVDICVSPFKACKGEAATAYCRTRGYPRALSWSHVIYPKTRHVSGGTCVPSGLVVCGGYNRIVCGS